MTRQLVALTLTVLMHIVCFAIMTERKYSVKKNSFNLFCIFNRLCLFCNARFTGIV